MRKSAASSDDPDQGRKFSLQPLLRPPLRPLFAAFLAAFRRPREDRERPIRPHTRGAIPEATLQFEALEPRVLLAADPGSAILTIAGSIDVPGEQDDYRFTVDEPSRIVFDSLSNRSDLRWRLDGAAGEETGRSFSATDYLATASPAYELAPGTYRLRIDGQQDALGDYALRLHDAASAAELVTGAPVSGVLEHGNETALYRFRASAGDSFHFKAGPVTAAALGWRLIDPFGRQEGGTFDAARDRYRFSVERSGEYLLLLEGAVGNAAPASYQFTLQAISDSASPLVLGEAATADIDQPGKTARFTFDLAVPTPVVFDRLTDASFYWSLHGPAGQHLARRLASSNTRFDGFERLLLPPGSYTLSVDTDGASTGSFPFRLLGADAAQPLAAGSTIAGQLDFARGSSLYRIALAAGDKVFLDPRSVTGGSLDWRLIDPYGVRVAAASFSAGANTAPAAARAPFTVATTGDYWLLLDGADSNPATAELSYQFALNVVPDLERALGIGDLITDQVATAGQTTVYRFELANETHLAFDAQSNRADLLWSLSGPRGNEVTDRPFDHSDGAAGFSGLTLPAGSYRLSVRGAASATGTFAFRLLDLAAAPELSLGAAVSGSLSPGNSTTAYRFAVAAGDQVALQNNSGSAGNAGDATWRLIDRFGREVSGAAALPAPGAAPEIVSLVTGGAYTLLIEGNASAATPISYDLQLNAAGHLAPAGLPVGEELGIGSLVAGLLPTSESSHTYRFTLASDSQLVFDTQGGASSAVWSLFGPRGSEVDRRTLFSSDAAAQNPTLTLPAGDYALTVEGAAPAGSVSGHGAYAFRLLDSASFPEITLGQLLTTARSPAASTIGHRVAATAGSTLLLQGGDSSGGVWRLLDRFGRQVSVTSVNAGQVLATRFHIPATGTYTLLNDGYSGANGRSNVTFLLTEPVKISAPLAFNRPISASSAGPGSVAEYRFTLDRATTVVFDALSGPDSRWMLAGPLGVVRGWTSFLADDGQIFSLPPGEYVLTLETPSVAAADYRFRVLDAAAADGEDSAGAVVDLPSGATVNETIPAGETRVYRFAAEAGERATFSRLDGYGVNGKVSWQLWDPYGHQLVALGPGVTEAALPVSGEYLLAIFPDFANAPPDKLARPIAFTFALASSRTLPLTLDQDIVGSIERPGESVSYGFTLGAPTSLLVDSGGAPNPDDFSWTLSGPRGREGPPQTFAGTRSRLLSLPAGNYQFTVTSRALATGGFSFRLLDLATQPALPFETPIALTLAPATRAQAYSLIVDVDSELLFVPTAATVRDGDWRVLDSLGRTLASGAMSQVEGPFALPAGHYSFVADGRQLDAGSDSYKFVMRRLLLHRQAISLDSGATGITEVAGSVDHPGQVHDYSFSIDAPTTLVFDALSERDDLGWELAGPTGLLRQEGRFGGPGIVAPLTLDGPGSYRLRVVPEVGATGDFRFRLLDTSRAEALPLNSAQELVLDPGSSIRIFRVDGQAGERLVFDVQRLVGGTASLQIFAADDPQQIFSASASAGSPIGTTLARGGQQLLMVVGQANSEEPLVLDYSATLASPHIATLAVGSEAQGSTAVSGLADQWRFSLHGPSRLLFDGLAGTRTRWTLRAADGTPLDSGWCASNSLLALDAGAYTLDVQAEQVEDLGAYAFRLLDFASAATLPLNQEVSGTLASPTAASIFRVPAPQQGGSLSIDAVASNGEIGSLAVFDPDGVALGEYLLPARGVPGVASSGAAGGERLLVVDGLAGATTALHYSLNARQTEPLRARRGDTLSGTLAHSGDRVSYRIAVPFSQPLPARAWVHNAGASTIRWRLAPSGAASAAPGAATAWWPDVEQTANQDANDWQVTAGDYELTIEATADDAAFTLQLLAGDSAPALAATGQHGQLAHGRDARVYRYDTGAAGGHLLQLESTEPASLQWALYDGSGQQLDGGDGEQRGTFDFSELAAGPHLLLVSGRAEATDSIDFDVAMSPTTVRPGDLVSGHLTAAGLTRSYALDLPVETYLQVHDQGSGAGVRWRIRPLATPPEQADWVRLDEPQVAGHDREAAYPYLDLFDSDRYVFEVSAAADAAFGFRLLDFDHAPVLAAGETVLAFAPGEQLKVFRVDPNLAGTIPNLAIATDPGEEIRWLLFDANQSLVEQGSSSGASITTRLDDRPYTIEFKRPPSPASHSALTASVAVVGTAVQTIHVDEVIAVSLAASTGYQRSFTVAVGERSRIAFDLLSALSDVDYDLLDASGRRLANSSLGDKDEPLVDLRPGTYSLRLYSWATPSAGNSSIDFSFRLLNAARADHPELTMGIPADGTLAPGSSLTQVYHLQARAGDSVSLAVSPVAGGDPDELDLASLYLFDPFGQLVAGDQIVNGPVPGQLEESGTYTVLVFGDPSLAGPAGYSIAATLLAQESRPPIASTPLAIGADLSDTLSGTTRAYRLTMTEPGLAIISGSTGADPGAEPWWAHWVLRDGAGFLTGDQGYWNAFETSVDPLSLAAGEYTLEVSVFDGTGGSIAFRVDGSGAASPADVGASFGDSGAVVYRVDLVAGEHYLLQASSDGAWSVYRPDFTFARQLAGQDAVHFVASVGGPWYFARDEDYFGAATVFVGQVLNPIGVGERVEGQLAAGGSGDTYHLTLSERKRLYLDLTQLDSPAQVLLFHGNQPIATVSAYSQQSFVGDFIELAAGEYRVEVRPNQWTTSDTAYTLRLLDFAEAPVLSLNAEVADGLQASEAAIYRIEGTAGGRIDYRPTELGGLEGWWQLFDRDRTWLASGNLAEPAGVPTLTPGGGYFVVRNNLPKAEPAATFRFALQTPQEIALGERVDGRAFAGTTHASYRFATSTTTRVVLDPARFAGNGSLAWRILRGEQPIGHGTLANAGTLADELAIVDLPAGSYLLDFDAGQPLAQPDDLAFRLLDLAQSQPLESGIPAAGQRPAGQAALFAFVATAGAELTLEHLSGNDDHWWLVDEFGQQVAHGEGSGSVDALPRSGSYTLLLDDDGSVAGGASTPATRDYSFRLSTGVAPLPAIAPNSVVSGTLDANGSLGYRVTITAPAVLWLTPLSASFDAHLEVRDAAGWRVHAADYFGQTRQTIQLPAPGSYTIELRDAYGRPDQRTLSFALSDLSAPTGLTPGSAGSGTVGSGSSVDAYRFSAVDGVSFNLDGSPATASGLRWTLVSPYGHKLAEGEVRSQSAPLPLDAGDYLLLVDGGPGHGTGTYSFVLNTPPTSATATPDLLRNSEIGATLAAGGQARYALHLEQAELLAFDSLTSSGKLWWRLDRPAGVNVFSQAMAQTAAPGPAATGSDFSGRLAAGDYTLLIGNVGGQPESSSFRVRDLASAAPLTAGTPVTTRLTPANSTQLFRFDALAGERYYLDALSTVGDLSSSGLARAVPQWKLLDPLGRTVFGPGPMGSASVAFDHFVAQTGQPIYRHGFHGQDRETGTLPISGRYTLVLDGLGAAGSEPALLSFELIKVPQAPAVVIDAFASRPAPNLVVSALAVNPVGVLQTGQTLSVDWQIENRGDRTAAGRWHDRIIVRNLDSGRVVADVDVPYDSSDPANGAIAAGDSRSRSSALTLPADAAAAGRLRVFVITDAGNVVRESSAGGANERDNARSIEIDVIRAPNSDLRIEGLGFDPAAAFDPGAELTVSWQTVNRGDQDAAPGWRESLELRNLSTRELIASSVVYDLPEAAPLAPGDSRVRSAAITWPSGTSAAGRFSLRVVAGVDPGSGSGTIHSAELIHVVGPDLQVRNLALDPGEIQAGGLLSIHWEDWNDGTSSTASAFDDRVVVRNLDLAQVLLDTSVTYDPLAATAGQSNGPIGAGEHRQRSFSFRLPDGLRGTGTIEIGVTADQDRGGVGTLFETNSEGDAESNNRASVHTLSASSAYADLRVALSAVPATALAGGLLTVDWQVANSGQAHAGADWDDQIVVSRDAVIGNADDLVVASFRHSGGLGSGESYAASAGVTLPLLAPRPYYLGVRADAGQAVAEPDTRDDNSAVSAFELLAAAADLSVAQVTAPDSAIGGAVIEIGWLVRNDGEATSDLALWNDRIVLSSDGLLDAGDIVVAATVPHAGVLTPGQGYLAERSVTLPAMLAGDYFVIVDTDTERRLAENGRTANNSAASAARLHIGQAPAADLAVANVVGPTALQPGQTGTVSYTTSNLGILDAVKPWRDRIYLDQGAAGLLEVGSVANSAPLAAAATVARSLTFTLPAATAEGKFRWLVIVDADDTIAEPAADNNHAVSATTVSIARSDLGVSSLSAANSVQSGSPLHVEWSVRNSGAVALGSWTDRVFLVRNGVPQPFAEVSRSGPLDAGASYAASAELLVPVDFFGAYELAVVTDADQALADRSRSNNRLVAPLTVLLAPSVDLVVDALTLSPAGPLQPGELVTAGWLTSNLGTRALEQAWSERLELRNLETASVVATIDLAGGASLAAGASRPGSAQFLWPQGVEAAGRFSLRVITDAGAQIAEANPGGSAEINNTAELFRVTGPDLVVRNLHAEAAEAAGLQAGGVLNIAWEDWNDGGSATDTAFMERIIVRNLDRGQIILDTDLRFDPRAEVGGSPGSALRPGESRQRAFSLTLPEGLKGSGRIAISVTADQSLTGAGVVFETNAGSNAESNNGASVVTSQKARACMRRDGCWNDAVTRRGRA